MFKYFFNIYKLFDINEEVIILQVQNDCSDLLLLLLLIRLVKSMSGIEFRRSGEICDFFPPLSVELFIFYFYIFLLLRVFYRMCCVFKTTKLIRFFPKRFTCAISEDRDFKTRLHRYT